MKKLNYLTSRKRKERKRESARERERDMEIHRQKENLNIDLGPIKIFIYLVCMNVKRGLLNGAILANVIESMIKVNI